MSYARKMYKYILKQTGKNNTGILLAVLADACDYALGKKELRDVRTIEIIFNNLHRTKCDLSKNMEVTH